MTRPGAGFSQFRTTRRAPSLSPCSRSLPSHWTALGPKPALTLSLLMQLMVRHWRGEAPLLTSIFATAILGTAAFVAVLRLLVVAATSFDLSVAAYARIDLIFLSACVALWVWACVGIWRAADHAKTKTRWVAQAGVALATLAISPHAWASAQTAEELALLALERDPLGPPAEVTAERDFIVLEGVISQHTADRFQAVLSTSKNVRLLVLSSRGGRVAEALRMANIVRDRRLDTLAVGECSSACTVLLVAGKERSIEEGAQVGFHRTTMAGYGPFDEQLAQRAASRDLPRGWRR